MPKPTSEHHSGIAELDERIPFLLAQLGAYVSSDFQRRLSSIGADPRTYAVLLALASADGQSQRQLSERLGIHRNAMVVVIDQLEQRGLAKRLPRPEDRRAVAVTLTAKARRLLPALHEQGRDLENEIAAPLSAKERATLRRLLQRVATGAGLIPGVHPQLA
ncbi:MarR family transcriptional regulator [Mycobacterium sp. WUMAC-067]|uniref:MarR family winged helix-turn-helix transcriptional regulator n=1 Tax=unclassified Mycobacterium TaxID=2642494 RepID=UPI001CD9B98A|nr:MULTISPECIES: MarR family transcriptional regulator [unclassified Mycobacterium]MCA2244978.1 MarR family transcriptional regulator [Mycobacterium sp. WUMAC-067]MCA2316405.1 MarR family transcriptional regulator [Mycobacterium sp. WUMAC-025]